MPKEAPIICDYLPKKENFFSISNQLIKNRTPSSEIAVKTYTRSWKEMKKQIRKESRDQKKLDLDDVQINEEIDRAEFDAESHCEPKLKVGKIASFVEISCCSETYVKEDIIPSDVVVAMQDRISSLFPDKSTKNMFGRNPFVRGMFLHEDELYGLLTNEEEILWADDLKGELDKGEIMPQRVNAEMGLNISLEGKNELTEEQKRIIEMIKKITKEAAEETEEDIFINNPKLYNN